MIKISLLSAIVLLCSACGASDSDPAGTGGAGAGGGQAGSGGATTGGGSGGQPSGGSSGSGAQPSGGSSGSGAQPSGGSSGSGGQPSGGSAGAAAASSGGSSGSGGAAGSGGGCDCTRGAAAPVCGADGNDYDAACGIQCVPVGVACLGSCPCDPGSGCAIGCTAMTTSGACEDGEVDWECQGEHRTALLLEAGCRNLPTDAIRYCCPSSFLSECQ